MAVLSDLNRARVWRALMRYWSDLKGEETGAFNSTQLLDAVNATDTFIDDNQTAFNNALPEPIRSELTADQKTLMFCTVAMGRVGIPMLRVVFQEVD